MTAETKKQNEELVRKCIVTGEVRDTAELVRFCVSPDGVLCPDLAHKLPGRGMWVSCDKEMILNAVEKGLFKKVAKQKVLVPENFIEMIDNLFVQRIKNLIGLGRKAGAVIFGFDKVEAGVPKHKFSYVVEATDGSIDGRVKVIRLCQKNPVEVVMGLTAQQMGEAVGTDNCVHLALTKTTISDLIVAELKRLAAFRQTDYYCTEKG
ncbi:MAG: RNA-binding protein [Alphaproteobacteria bacterium]|nr:RNA-binding protein [Alphaproteobacteria bacterium]